MTQASGYLRKMRTEAAPIIRYAFAFEAAQDTPSWNINDMLGKSLRLCFTGSIRCVACAREIKKSYQQGYCFPCTQKLAACDICIVKPERCHFDRGTCRQPDWGLSHCMQPHIVYLSYTSGVKVGITRKTQMPTRWHDQGATSAVAVMQVATRYQSGCVEQLATQWFKDKTEWRRMLKNHESVSLHDDAQYFIQQFLHHTEQLAPIDHQLLPLKTQTITYPILDHTAITLKSIDANKTPRIEGKLIGVKGQYLLFEHGVINIRKFQGHHVEIEVR